MKYYIWHESGPLHPPLVVGKDLEFSGYIYGYLYASSLRHLQDHISFTSFLRVAHTEKIILVFDFNSFWANTFLFEHLKKLAIKNNFILMNIREFCVEHNLSVMYEKLADEREQILNSKSELLDVADNFTDEFSRNGIRAYLESYEKKSLAPLRSILIPHQFEMFNRFSKHFSFVPTDSEIYVDVGSYDGDSVLKFIEATPSGAYKKIVACEPTPAPRTFLEKKLDWVPNLEIQPFALSDKPGSIEMISSGMGSRINADSEIDRLAQSRINVEVKTLDSIVSEATLIKIDVEGFEVSVINGAKRLISSNKPSMVVDTYHYPNDIQKIYNSVMNIHRYKYVSWRLYHQDLHSLFFSDTQELF